MPIHQFTAEERIAQLELENSRLATIANDQCDKTLLRAAICAAWHDGYRSNFGPVTPAWIQKQWLASNTHAGDFPIFSLAC